FVLVNGSRATPFLAGPTQRLRLRFTTTTHLATTIRPSLAAQRPYLLRTRGEPINSQWSKRVRFGAHSGSSRALRHFQKGPGSEVSNSSPRGRNRLRRSPTKLTSM